MKITQNLNIKLLLSVRKILTVNPPQYNWLSLKFIGVGKPSLHILDLEGGDISRAWFHTTPGKQISIRYNKIIKLILTGQFLKRKAKRRINSIGK